LRRQAGGSIRSDRRGARVGQPKARWYSYLRSHHGKENRRLCQAASPGGKANPRPNRSRARSAWSEHHEFCKRLTPRRRAWSRSADSGGDHCVRRQELHLHHEDAACDGADQKAIKLDKVAPSRTSTRWAPLRAPSWKKLPRPKSRPDCGQYGRSGAHHCRHSPFHGHHRGGDLRWLMYQAPACAQRKNRP